jgi:hypothetical protein
MNGEICPAFAGNDMVVRLSRTAVRTQCEIALFIIPFAKGDRGDLLADKFEIAAAGAAKPLDRFVDFASKMTLSAGDTRFITKLGETRWP